MAVPIYPSPSSNPESTARLIVSPDQEVRDILEELLIEVRGLRDDLRKRDRLAKDIGRSVKNARRR